MTMRPDGSVRVTTPSAFEDLRHFMRLMLACFLSRQARRARRSVTDQIMAGCPTRSSRPGVSRARQGMTRARESGLQAGAAGAMAGTGEASPVAVAEGGPPGVVGVHELCVVVDVVQANDVSELVHDDR